MHNEFVETLVYTAFNEIGVREETKNAGTRIREYQTATTLGEGVYPWCAAFVSWCLKRTLESPQIEKLLRNQGILRPEVSTRTWRCRSARAFDWVPWARKNNLQVIENAVALARKGDIIVYDFSHIGIVAIDQLASEHHVVAIEGNTNYKGLRDGDGVYARHRPADPSIITAYIRVLP